MGCDGDIRSQQHSWLVIPPTSSPPLHLLGSAPLPLSTSPLPLGCPARGQPARGSYPQQPALAALAPELLATEMVVNSSPTVGWMPTVRSSCAYVSPPAMAMASP